jgi:hypothetical protein
VFITSYQGLKSALVYLGSGSSNFFLIADSEPVRKLLYRTYQFAQQHTPELMQMHSAVLFEVFYTGFIFLAPVLEHALQLL